MSIEFIIFSCPSHRIQDKNKDNQMLPDTGLHNIKKYNMLWLLCFSGTPLSCIFSLFPWCTKPENNKWLTGFFSTWLERRSPNMSQVCWYRDMSKTCRAGVLGPWLETTELYYHYPSFFSLFCFPLSQCFCYCLSAFALQTIEI